MKHTPGPWYLDGQNIITQDNHGIGIAFDPNDSCHQTETTLANARLIAACPKLLLACKEALRELEHLNSDEVSDRQEYVAPSLEIIELLSEVIIEAEGQ